MYNAFRLSFKFCYDFYHISNINYINNLNHFQLVPFLFSSALICCSFPYICFPPLSLQYQFDHNVVHIQMAYATHTHTFESMCILPTYTDSIYMSNAMPKWRGCCQCCVRCTNVIFPRLLGRFVPDIYDLHVRQL